MVFVVTDIQTVRFSVWTSRLTCCVVHAGLARFGCLTCFALATEAEWVQVRMGWLWFCVLEEYKVVSID